MTTLSSPLWRDRNFLVFWAGQGLSVLGDGFAAIAMPLLVLRATGSVAQMGAVTATMAAGRIAGALVAGVIADRWDRRRTMIACDLARALLFGALPAFVHGFGLSMPFIFVCVAVASFTGNIFHVACFASLPSLVGRDRIVSVNSWLWATYSLAGFVGPLLGGITCARYGPTLGIGADAISFLISAVSIALIRFRTMEPLRPMDSSSPPAERAEFRLASILLGLRFVWRTPILRTMVLGLSVIAFLTEARTDLVIYELEHEAGANADRIGVVLGVGSLGAIVGGTVAQRIFRASGVSGTWLWMSILASVPLVGIGLASQALGIGFVAILLSVLAFGETVRGVVSQSVRHQVTPDGLLGRVTSAYWVIADLPAALGAFVMTNLAMKLGVSVAFVVAGIGAFVTALGAWLLLRNVAPKGEATSV